MSTQQQRQRVSALMDGEVGRFEAAAAVKDLTRSPDLAGHWERWHLIGRALRHERSDLHARATADRVRAAADAQMPGAAIALPAAAVSSRRRRVATAAPLLGAVAAGVLVLGLGVVLTGPLLQDSRAPQGLARVPQTVERWQQPDPAVRARLDRLLVNHQEQVSGIGRSGVGAYAAVIGYERRP
ncbi:sigma-E factor negative regulatory protein [Thiohalocapsa sp.]|jgi:sigma-E factor negative regulatory protein RseA|uniref:sigma-E factor negative regulatory protein n=1 Tax=Thiohalocapsa sp. TaxID=2497641 RepID=UPI0025ECC96A|nr:sigma-E factor negative regulatory protein [Thiohalocapsa sp.]